MLSALISSNNALISSNNEFQNRIETLETELDIANNELSVASVANTGPIKHASLQNLELMGVESKMADEMLALQDQLEKELLYLQDHAARGGWLVSDQYRQAHTRLMTSNNPIRLTLGDEAFQQYLDASGQESAIIINDILPGAALTKDAWLHVKLKTNNCLISQR